MAESAVTEFVKEWRLSCETGQLDKATELLMADGEWRKIDPVQGWGDRKITPLHWGCLHGHLGFAKMMIEKYHCDPNLSLVGEHCETPLHMAAVEGHLEVVKYLTEEARCIADVKRGRYRRTPMTYACGFAPFPKHHYSKDEDAIEVVRHLYNNCNCDPNYRDGFGMTALHNACANRRFVIVKFLLSECNCNVALCDAFGNSPLHLVCSRFSLPKRDNQILEAVEIIRYLIVHHKCDLNAVNLYGEKPIDATLEPELIAEFITFSPQGRKAGLYKNPDSFLSRSKPC